MNPAPDTQARPAIDVAVGILIDDQGRHLLTTRPIGKVFEGHWEFPGGKFEAGEGLFEALKRELVEELGITILDCAPWRELEVDYPHARVRLHLAKVRSWSGELRMIEGQAMSWEHLPTALSPILPGTVPILAWLNEEMIDPPSAEVSAKAASDATASPAIPSDASWLEAIAWNGDGLVPVIAQEVGSKDVLMMAWMNREALTQTLERGVAVYYSRSRKRLWMKGETTGHVQKVHGLRLDCDADAILMSVEQLGHTPGIACHTGRHSCFFQGLEHGAWRSLDPILKPLSPASHEPIAP